MFLKSIVKTDKTTGARKEHFRLVESYRCDGTVKHFTIVHFGTLPELPEPERRRLLGRRIEQLLEARRGHQAIFMSDSTDTVIEQLAQKYCNAIQEQERKDAAAGKDFHIVDVNSVDNEQVREVGAESLCLQAVKELGIDTFLRAQGWDAEQIQLALTHIVSRAVYPASELRTSKWITENSAICELTGYPVAMINKDRLYAISHLLYAVKDGLEKHLSKRTNEIFDLQDSAILYDLTNTYYEGVMRNSKIASFGRSKEKRSDARLVVLAVVVNTEGFLKYSNIYEGNTADSTTLQHMLTHMSAQTSATARKPVVVLDAGIATEANIALLRKEQYDYMCVSRSSMKKYAIDTTRKPIVITDNKQQPITLQRVTVEKCTDTYLQVQSKAKGLKEASMKSRTTQRFEQGLSEIQVSLSKPRGTKVLPKVWERIGRLKQKYPAMHKHYDIRLTSDKKDIVTAITWSQKPTESTDGIYLLRTNLNEKDEHTQWTIYNSIREIEATFRTLKTDLDLRPIYHKTDAASMAHLHLGLLAYWVVNTIRYRLKQSNIKNEWNDIVRIMNTQKMVTTTMRNNRNEHIRIRQCSKPEVQTQAIYRAMSYKEIPLKKTKVVVPPG